MHANGDGLIYREREPSGDARGTLILLHGRGADEHDLFPLLDMLDPERKLVGVTPRGPLSMPPGGAHWYRVMQVGYPDPSTFFPTYERLTGWYDAFLGERDIDHDKVVLGGFSQGAVMSYALALGPGRPRSAALMPFSGFIPTVEGFDIDLSDVKGWPVAISHGTYDPIIEVGWGRDANEQLTAAGAAVDYRESPIPHSIDPERIAELGGFVTSALGI